MATRTGAAVTGTKNLCNAVNINISMQSNEYPHGAISWTMTGYPAAHFVLPRSANPGVTYTYTIYLCDSGKGNQNKIATLSLKGNESYVVGSIEPKSGSVNEAIGLTGKPLYITAACTGISKNDTPEERTYFTNQLELRCGEGQPVFSVNTKTVQSTPTVVVPTYTASDFSSANVNYGNACTVKISNAYISALSHKVTWSLPSHSQTQDVGKGVASASFTIPTSWLDGVAADTSATLKITVATYNGSTKVGEVSHNYTAYVPDSIKPSVSSITFSIRNPASAFSNMYIQNKTGVNITINGAAPGTSAMITKYSVTASTSDTCKQDSGASWYVATLKNGGKITFTATVYDSRGRTASVSGAINVQSYTKPSFSSVDAFRCNLNKTPDDNGRYGCITASASYTPFTGNSMTISSKYYKTSASGTKYVAVSNMTSGASYLIGDNSIDPNYTYEVEFTVKDTVGSSVTATAIIKTAPYAIHVKNGGNGVAFGKASEYENAVEITDGWDLYYKGKKVLLRSYTGGYMLFVNK